MFHQTRPDPTAGKEQLRDTPAKDNRQLANLSQSQITDITTTDIKTLRIHRHLTGAIQAIDHIHKTSLVHRSKCVKTQVQATIRPEKFAGVVVTLITTEP